MEENATFEYGFDVNVYLQKAIDVLKTEYHYHWASVSLLHDQVRYAIEEENGVHHYVSYTTFDEDDVEREVLDVAARAPYGAIRSGDEFIRLIVADNEFGMLLWNSKVRTYPIRFERGICTDGWYLERYEFNRLKTGDFSAFVQAGDRMSGGSRDFLIPPEFLSGTFEEFLDRYETLVPGKSFGLYKKDLIGDEGLKRFLGFR